MRLDLGQTAERLGVTKDRVRQLESDGRLTNLHTPKEGATKIYRLYDSKQVNAVKAEGNYPLKRRPRGRHVNPNGHAGQPTPAPTVHQEQPTSAAGIFSRLERIEQKIDRLLATWS